MKTMLNNFLRNCNGAHLLLVAVKGNDEIITAVDHELDRRAGIGLNNYVRNTSGRVANLQELQPAM